MLGQLKHSFRPEGYEEMPSPESHSNETGSDSGLHEQFRRPPFDFRLEKIFVRGFPPDVCAISVFTAQIR